MTYDELNARQYALAQAILGGAVVPKVLDTISTEDLVGLITAERAQTRDTQDALVAAAASEAREAALREAATAAFERLRIWVWDCEQNSDFAHQRKATNDEVKNAILDLIG